MRFEWDPKKSRRNKAKHGVSFELAVLVFDDPHAVNLPNDCEDEERWLTVGSVGAVLVLAVVHTWEEQPDEEEIRIISARKATRPERETYENQYTKA